MFHVEHDLSAPDAALSGLVRPLFGLAAPDDALAALLLGELRRQCATELAGLFWIGAEVFILVLVCAARRHIERDALSPTLRGGPQLRRRLLVAAGGLTALGLVLALRYVLAPPPAALYGGLAHLSPAAAASMLASAQRRFQGVAVGTWFLFVNAWVLLEVLIVWHGYRGYVALCRRLSCSPLTPAVLGPPLVGMVVAAATLVASVAGSPSAVAGVTPSLPSEPDSLLRAWQEAVMADAPISAALQFHLRLAGTVWIGTEWVAALALVRVCTVLHRAAAVHGRVSSA